MKTAYDTLYNDMADLQYGVWLHTDYIEMCLHCGHEYVCLNFPALKTAYHTIDTDMVYSSMDAERTV